MKYKTFRGISLAGGVVAVLFGCGAMSWWCVSALEREGAKKPAETAGPPRVAVTAAPQPVPMPGGPNPGSQQGSMTSPALAATNATAPLTVAERARGIPLRPFDMEILARAAGSISGDKVKDAMPGRSYKVNLYQDAGEARVNRLKIDLDRDDKFDEKWTLSPARDDIRRQVSTSDDDKTYDEEYRLRGDMWLKK